MRYLVLFLIGLVLIGSGIACEKTIKEAKAPAEAPAVR